MSRPITDWDKFRYFVREEFVCHCGCGVAAMDEDFLIALEALRNMIGTPIVITSGFRCSDYNQQVSNTGPDGPHTTGKAADFQVDTFLRYKVLRHLEACGFTGVGFGKNFTHVDTLTKEPRPNSWVY